MKVGKKSKTLAALAVGLALIVLGSVLAQAFHTSFYSVKVSRVYFDTESGTLSGLLYMPKGVDASNLSTRHFLFVENPQIPFEIFVAFSAGKFRNNPCNPFPGLLSLTQPLC